MLITIQKKALLALISRTKGATDAKSAMPVLANVLLTADAPAAALGSGTLTASATDLYRSARASAECEVSRPGGIGLPAADLELRVRAMPDGPIEVEALSGDNGSYSAALRAGGGAKRRYTIHGLPAGEFTAMPAAAEDARTFAVPAAVVAELAARALTSVSDDESRAHVNSALFQWHEAGVRMVSTDGHRLSLAEAHADGIYGTGEMLVQKRALIELQRLAESADGAISFAVGAVWVFAVVDTVTYGFKQVDARFPPYQQVIPANGTALTVKREALLDALKAVSVASGDVSRGVKLTFSDRRIAVASSSPSGGEGFDEVACDGSGDGAVVGFNAGYLCAALAAVSDVDITLSIGGELDPCKVTGAGGRYVAVVMPTRI